MDYAILEVAVYQVYIYSSTKSLYDYMTLDEAYEIVKYLNKVYKKENFYFVIEIK